MQLPLQSETTGGRCRVHRMFRRRGRILKVRPGLLANFSGGAGYMPFVVIWSVPASLIAGLVGALVLHAQSRCLRQNRATGSTVAPLDLIAFGKYARRHFLICLILSLIAGGVLSVVGSNMVYGDKLKYLPATLLLAAGPFVAWSLSTYVLVRLIIRNGARWFNPLLGILAHLLILAGFVALGMMVS